MRYYGTLLNTYTIIIRDTKGRLEDPTNYGYTLEDREKLEQVWIDHIADFESRIDELREEAQNYMRNRPLWKKLTRTV